MTNEEMIKRVATRSIRADQQQTQEGPQQQQALPQSGAGKMIVKKSLDELNAAFEAQDDAGFDKALDNLIKNKGTRSAV